MSPSRKWILPLVLVLVVVGFIALTLRPGSSEKTETYSGLVQRVTDDPGSVQEVVFSPNRQGIEATLTDGTKIKTSYPSDQAQIQFQDLLVEKEREVRLQGHRRFELGVPPLSASVRPHHRALPLHRPAKPGWRFEGDEFWEVAGEADVA